MKLSKYLKYALFVFIVVIIFINIAKADEKENLNLCLSMMPPITIETVGYYKDGGTVGIILKDKKDFKILCSFEGRAG